MKIKKIKLINKKILMFIYSLFHKIDNNKIVFSSFGGKQYSDSGRRLGEELYKRNNNLKIVWLLNKNAIEDKYNIIPEYVIKKENNFINFIKEVCTAKVYIVNEYFELIYKRKNQMFIDTWHGDRGFKRILHEEYESGLMDCPVYDDKVVDYCIAASEFAVERYRKAFLYNGLIINEGMPRNDMLVCNNIDTNEIKRNIGIGSEKILLYAPTFRDNNNSVQNITIDFNKILNELSKEDGSNWKLVIRSHPASHGVNVIIDENKMLDLTDYPDMSDILLISDFLITDYSSSAVDFVLTKKPIILLLYDYEDYKNKCRDFIADPKKVGFLYADNEEELIDLIKTTKQEDYLNAYKLVYDYYKINETGKSTEFICDKIINFASNK